MFWEGLGYPHFELQMPWQESQFCLSLERKILEENVDK
jgi:hypothetical protein